MVRNNFTNQNKRTVVDFINTLLKLGFRCKHLVDKDDDPYDAVVYFLNRGNVSGYARRLWYYSESYKQSVKDQSEKKVNI